MYFTSDDVVAAVERGEPAVLVRTETSPDDVEGMQRSQAVAHEYVHVVQLNLEGEKLAIANFDTPADKTPPTPERMRYSHSYLAPTVPHDAIQTWLPDRAFVFEAVVN